MKLCEGPGNKTGPRKRYRCKWCGRTQPETAYRIIGTHGAVDKVCRHCRKRRERARADSNAPATHGPVPWPIVTKQYELTDAELALVLEAAGRWGKSGHENSCLGLIEQEVDDPRRQVQLLNCVGYYVEQTSPLTRGQRRVNNEAPVGFRERRELFSCHAGAVSFSRVEAPPRTSDRQTG